MSLIAEYAKRTIVMTQKRVLMDGKVEEIFSRVEELARTNILPPQITRLSQQLRAELPLEKEALNMADMGELLLAMKKRRG
jgi:ABC-type glutathione transport system ATPase component